MLETGVIPDPEPLVGSTGGAAVDNGGHVSEPQARSVGQQPPPRLAGQVRKPVLQVNGPWPVGEYLLVDSEFIDGVMVVV